MADTASKEVPATYVGTSKVAQTEYPVSSMPIGPILHLSADLEVAHRQRPVRSSLLILRLRTTNTLFPGI